MMLPKEIEITIRVRYSETDQMGVVHHSQYPRYFEIARMEQFRGWGCPYSELEKAGTYFMVITLKCHYRTPAYFDDVLTVKAWIHKMTRFRIIHHYLITKEDGKINTRGATTLAAVDRDGVPQLLPIPLWDAWQTINQGS
jgi:acyl-CoA thioester hydrolase